LFAPLLVASELAAANFCLRLHQFLEITLPLLFLLVLEDLSGFGFFRLLKRVFSDPLHLLDSVLFLFNQPLGLEYLPILVLSELITIFIVF